VKRVVVTGGGSGGHTMPAVAAIRAMQSGGGFDPVYVGSATGIESEAAAEAGVPFHAIRTGKLRRARRWYGLFTPRNAADVFNVVAGWWQAWRLLRSLRPAVVLSTGGFVAVPVVYAAWALRIPSVIHEQTVQFGLANRLCARAATRIALSNELALELLRPAWREKAVVTGNPVRPEIEAGSDERARERFGLNPSLPTVLVSGGAQGAETINRTVRDALADLLAMCNVIHPTGRAAALTTTYAVVVEAAREAGHGKPGHYHPAEFFDADTMGDAYAAATLMVGRSGAGTTNDLALTGTPSILVPLVPTGGDEQRKIAEWFRSAGAAVVIPNDDLSAERLVSEVRALLEDRERLEQMSSAARGLARRNAAEALVGLVERAAA
jgi:UDP-N-acetylglucosamine--N-acetylmuramyl-(pentapeptide) pyrophosphoryl-undecaprenol N-acetylglucosamine transferase